MYSSVIACVLMENASHKESNNYNSNKSKNKETKKT